MFAQALDAALRGGVPCGGVTELVGPAGVGKSQLCLMLVASVLTGLGASAGGQARPSPHTLFMAICVVAKIQTSVKLVACKLVEVSLFGGPAPIHSVRMSQPAH